MDPLAKYLQKLCLVNHSKNSFVIDVAKVSADLSTECMILGYGHIIRVLASVLNAPHITSVSKDGSQITVEITRK